MQYANPEKRRELPEEEWSTEWEKTAADGSEFKLRFRTIDFDPLEQTKTIQIRTEVWREGERVYWHGSSASRALRASNAAEVCLTVTILDGMVMARSAFHHSVNYRSVMIKGRAEKVTDPEAKARHLETMVEQLFPGRWAMLREMTAQEVKATTVLSMPINEVSAKVRPGMPVDDDEDYELPIWAGVIPVCMEVLPPESDPRNLSGVTVPKHAHTFAIG